MQRLTDAVMEGMVYPYIKFALGCVTPLCITVLRVVGVLYEGIVRLSRAILDRGVHVTPMKHAHLRGEWVYTGAANGKKSTVLYLHGGAFILGSPAQSWTITSELARQLPHSRLLVLAYRKAPEHPFPAGLDDCVSAYRHLVYDLRVPADSIVLMGDSAGGNLATGLALYCDGAQLPKAAALVLLSPWLNPSTATTTLARHALLNGDPMLPVHVKDAVVHLYLYGSCMRHSPPVIRNAGLSAGDRHVFHWLISPMMAADTQLKQLPPLSIQVGAREALLHDCRTFVERVVAVRGQCVATELTVWEGLPHVFQQLPGVIPEARKSMRRAARFVAQQLAGRSQGASRAV